MRRFIGSMVVGLLVCALASFLVPAIAVAGGYEYAGKWGTKGTGNGQFDGIGGIAVDGSGNVYVSDWSNKRIEKFTESGAFLAKWGTLDSSIYGLAVDRAGNVYAADWWGARILKFSSSGALLAQFDTTIAGDTTGSNPYSIAVASSGNIWVTDSGDYLLKKFSSSGSYLGRLGTEGSGPGQLEFPVAVAVDPSDNVYVVDCLNYTVQKFTSSGTYLDGRVTIAPGDANLLRPVRVGVDGAGNTYVADKFSGTLFSDASVKKFDSSFVLQTRIGVYSGSAVLDGTFSGVAGIAIGASGKVYLADNAFNRVIEFTPVSVIPAPTITGFTPTSGPVGTTVTLTGTAFTGATKVAFHGATATTFSVVGATKVTATVPASATTGTIAVTTPAGSGTSATSFTVTTPLPVPTVTLKLSGLTSGAIRLGKRVTAKGKVTPASLAGSKVKLTVQKKKGAKWVTLKTTLRTISVTGAYSWKYKPAKRGAYRMRARVAKTLAHAAAKTPWRKFKVK